VLGEQGVHEGRCHSLRPQNKLEDDPYRGDSTKEVQPGEGVVKPAYKLV